MRGYTKQQLDAKGAKLTNYILCDNCKLYWHRRIFEKHLRPPQTRRIKIWSPAFEEFMDFLAEAAVKQWLAEVANGTYKPEPTKNVKAGRVQKSKSKRVRADDDDEVLTVDEAAARFGLSREEILARSEPIWEPFEFFVPSATRTRKTSKGSTRVRRRSRESLK